MSILQKLTKIEEFEQKLASASESMREAAAHLGHIHNLQHGIIHELMNNRLYMIWDNLGLSKVFEFEYEGIPIKMFLSTGPDDLIQHHILRNRSFFHTESLEMIRSLMPMVGERILDVGAYIGNHTVFFSKICGASEVECFEPIRTSFRALSRNVELNEVGAKLHNIGLGAESSEARAVLNPTNVGGSSLQTAQGGGIKICALDDLEIAPFRAMKIDVEGMALDVLKGARRTITTNCPTIHVEAFPYEFEAINEFLISMNYRKIGQVHDDHVYAM